MNWHDEPVTKPYCCNLCGNGAESKATYGPFLVTDWMYEETSGAEYVDKLSTGNFRFTICAVCVRAIVALLAKYDEGHQVTEILKAIGVDKPDDVLTVQRRFVEPAAKLHPERNSFLKPEDRGELIRDLIHALDERDAQKMEARAEKAKATRARNKAAG